MFSRVCDEMCKKREAVETKEIHDGGMKRLRKQYQEKDGRKAMCINSTGNKKKHKSTKNKQSGFEINEKKDCRENY